jgi:lipopolysaccharide export system permease protein
MDNATHQLSRLDFDDYTIDLKYLDDTMDERWLEPGDRTLTQLLTPSTDPRDKDYQGYFIAEANSRIASPLFMLDFTFIGLACLLVGEFDRRGQAKRIVKAVVIAISVQMVEVGISNLSRKYNGVIPMLYVAGALPIVICCLFIQRRSESLKRFALPAFLRLRAAA